MRKSLLYLLLGLVLLGMSGCRTQKRVATKAHPKMSAEQVLLQQVIAAQPQLQTAQASKVRMSVGYAERKISANGSISIITDSLLIVAVQPLLGIELFRLEMTPSNLLLVDKMNRRYARMTYAEVAQETGLPLTFSDLQAVFLNRLFVIGAKQNEILSLPFLSHQQNTEQQLLLQHQGLAYTFAIEPQTAALRSTRVEQTAMQAYAQVDYLAHQLYDEVYLPTTFRFTLSDGKQHSTTCEMTLLKVQLNQPLSLRPTDLTRYEEVALTTIIPR